ncbi:MAG: 4'-phosphopantetheinyl transferase superfamily protein [Planctomycetes bacterium]|nr:4'-phosphopantetheinyl transferase superfamily protein [Planctomycetota bacterium]
MNSTWPTSAEHPLLPTDEAHVWAAPLDIASTRFDTLWNTLRPHEQQRADQFRLDAPRHRFVIARAALRILLGRYLGVEPGDMLLTVDANGKPRLANRDNVPELHFNMAHSDQLALIGVTRGCEIGVDVERLRTVRHAAHIAQRYFHPNEVKTIEAAPPNDRDAAFMRCWTCKEAILKAIGVGITDSLAAFQAPIVDDGGRGSFVAVPTHSHGKSARCWLQRLNPGDDYVAAVAVVGIERKIRCMTVVL